MDAEYVFRVRLRLEPAAESVRVDPDSAEATVTVSRDAPDPGTEGWLFFRNALWRGEVADQRYARQLAADWLGEPLGAIESVEFREFQADEEYFDAMKGEIASNLEAFKADNVSEVLSKYLGSSIRLPSDADE
ncbi:LWR-salt protein [Natronococcus wangiae]|uniref:LWR-salt protein n=1 Tax=Natronococcus wangiae TaxID=3068275 RepID=UPI00273DABEF|nr:LWR-salt protein [Natronococcus sp. AD5]